jgi:hypothetical protein
LAVPQVELSRGGESQYSEVDVDWEQRCREEAAVDRRND